MFAEAHVWLHTTHTIRSDIAPLLDVFAPETQTASPDIPQ